MIVHLLFEYAIYLVCFFFFCVCLFFFFFFFFFQAEDGIRDPLVTGVQTCALPISLARWFGLRRRQVPCLNLILKADFFVRAVAEGFVRRVAAAAQRHGGLPCQPKGFSLRIQDFKIAFDANGSIVSDGDPGCGHFFSPQGRKYAFSGASSQSAKSRHEPLFLSWVQESRGPSQDSSSSPASRNDRCPFGVPWTSQRIARRISETPST